MNGAVRVARAGELIDLHADAAIVGSGAGSLAVAGELSRQGMSVIVIEAGPALGVAPGRHLRNIVPGDEAFLAELGPRLRPHANAATPWPGLPGAAGVHAVGGMLGFWSHAVPRPHLQCECDGVVSADTLDDLLTRAEMLMWATSTLYGDGSPRQRWIKSAIDAQLGRSDATTLRLAGRNAESGVEWAGGDNLLSDARGLVTIVPDTVVRRLVHTGARAQALLCVEKSSKREHRVEAEVIVVGGGIIGTPQLLFASGLNTLPALGRYLTDHLNVVTRVLLKEDAAARDEAGDAPVGLYVPVSEDRPFHTGILDIPSSAHAGILAGSDHLRTTDIGAFVGTEPVADNRLVFDAARPDAFGLPSVSAEMHLTENDHKRAAQAVGLQYEIAAAIGEPWRGMTPMFRPVGSSLHLMGACRIGRDAETSVADKDCRVWGFDNLYVAGNGVLGSRNSCNPTLTTIALGLGAADAIVGAG